MLNVTAHFACWVWDKISFKRCFVCVFDFVFMLVALKTGLSF